jgi:hypothetical protein
VAGAYRATPTHLLETETYTPPLDIHLDEVTARSRLRLKDPKVKEIIQRACKRIQTKLRLRTGRRRPDPTPGETKNVWAEAWLKEGENQAVEVGRPQERQERTENQKVRKRGVDARLFQWEKRWRARPPAWGQIGCGPPSQEILELHKDLQKAESALAIQIRTGRIGLSAFLNKMKVPGFDSPNCSCGNSAETASHIIAFCPRFNERRNRLDRGTVNLRTLTTTNEGLKKLVRWFMKLRILKQFGLAEELIYGGDEVQRVREQAQGL